MIAVALDLRLQLKAQDLFNHAFDLPQVPTSKKDGMVQHVVKIVNFPSLFMTIREAPFAVIAIVKVTRKPTKEICHGNVSLSVTVLRRRSSAGSARVKNAKNLVSVEGDESSSTLPIT